MTYDKAYYERNKERIAAKRMAMRTTDREAVLRREAEYRKNNPKVIRASWLQTQYGISQWQWDAMLKKQKGMCAICKTTDPGNKRGWHTDADHSNGEVRVRGLLCRSCNTGLGKFKHDYALMRAAASYLKRNLPNG